MVIKYFFVFIKITS